MQVLRVIPFPDIIAVNIRFACDLGEHRACADQGHKDQMPVSGLCRSVHLVPKIGIHLLIGAGEPISSRRSVLRGKRLLHIAYGKGAPVRAFF